MPAAVAQKKNRLSREEQQLLNQMLNLGMSGGNDASIDMDRDQLTADGNFDAFFLYYFPNDFAGFERLNYEFLNFLESDNQGMAWLPGGHGKALDCDTPILTTAGWKTMGTIEVGDYVYDSEGQPTKVTLTSEVFYDHPCYEVTFTDGAKIIADEDHLWKVWDEYASDLSNGGKRHGAWRVYSTKEMVSKRWKRERGNQVGHRFYVKCDAVVESPKADLPIDPYVLGYWLGDGYSAGARIIAGQEDYPHLLDQLIGAGYDTGSINVDARTYAITIGVSGLYGELRKLGLLGNKHIPDLYLTASPAQRYALLRGLMDSDGTISRVTRDGKKAQARVEFSVCSERLARDFHRLARSLGVRTSVVVGDATIKDRVVGKRYRIAWVPQFNPFRMERKAAVVQQPIKPIEKMTITGITPVESRPTRCIKVDSEDHVYLAGELFTPTHNTTTLLHWMVYVMVREPQISFIYCEKSEPAASQRARALMDILEFNEKLVHDFGEFKSRWWSANAITIKQRPIVSQWPTVAFFGAQSKATLGSRTNIMIVDDPVTADNSSSELERIRLRDWYSQAAATCPYPLPIKKEQYLRKLFLVGTTFHMDDLYHTVLKTDMYKHLWLKAVDLKTGETLSPRFTYRTREELKPTAESNPMDARLLEQLEKGKVISLAEYRKGHGTKAFMRRYQNEVRDDSTAKFPELWFRGGEDDWSPPGGYPGCLEDNNYHTGRSLGEKPEAKNLTVVTGVDPAGGTKGQYTARFACVTLGCDIQGDPNTVYLLDIDYGQQPMVSDNPAKKSQMDIVLDHVRDYNGRVVLEVNNVQGVWAQALRQEAQRRGTSISITGHHTSHSKKIDPQQGIEAMAAMIENGHLRLPYKSMTDKKRIDELIEEFTYWGSYATDDILMAFWFAWRAIERKKRHGMKTTAERREKPVYMVNGDNFNFPSHWSDARKAAYLGLTEETPDDDD